MITTRSFVLAATAAALTLGAAAPAAAQGVLNLYSSRHYDTDERLYSDFEELTGVTINRIEAGADELIERMRAEGESSPADVLLTVDAGRIGRAAELGLLQPTESELLEARIPAYLQDEDNRWFGFSMRARIIFYDPDVVVDPPMSYEELADPQYRGMICARSSTNIYMISLLASIIEAHGEEAAREWAEGLYANLARQPQGGDTDQLRALASGECSIAVSNTYYFARAIRRDVEGLSEFVDGIAWVFPNQSDRGTHVNISAAGIATHAPNYDNALLFLEYLASRQAQEYFSAGNDEFPVVSGVALSPSVAQLGFFRADPLNLTALVRNASIAVTIYDEVGYP